MKYNATKIISMVMVLILILSSFSGCFSVGDQSDESTKPIESTKLSENKELREAYYNLEAVKHIDDIMSEVIDVPLSDMNDIKELCLQKYAPKYDFINSENIEIIVRGKYEDMYAVAVYGIFQDDTSEIVGGYEFGYSETTPLNFIRDKKIYSLTEVYEKGWINDAELYRLFIKCKRIQYEFDCIDYVKGCKTINVTVMISQNNREYTPEDFPEINCVKVKDVSSQKLVNQGQLAKTLRLYVEETSPQKMLEYVCILAKRADTHIVSPGMSVNIQLDATPNDVEYRDGGQWAINKIFLPDAWDITTGSSSV